MSVLQQGKTITGVILVALLAVLLAAGALYVKSERQGYQESTQERHVDEVPRNEDFSDTTDEANSRNGDGAANTGGNNSGESTAQPINPVLTVLDTSQDGSRVLLRAYSEEESSNCRAVFVKNSQQVTRTAGTSYQGGQYVCQGFDIPRTEFGSGAWQLTLTMSHGEKSGKITGSIDIK